MRDTLALFSDFLNCQYKAFLKLKGETGEESEFQQLKSTLNAGFCQRVTDFLSDRHPTSEIVRQPTSFRSVMRSHRLFLDVKVGDGEQYWTFDAIESKGSTGNTASERSFEPLRCGSGLILSKKEKLLAVSDGIKLAEHLGRPVEYALVIHGPSLAVTKLKITGKAGLTNLAKEAGKSMAALQTMVNAPCTEPQLVLNSHCDVCEFKRRCYAEAERRDDLSLMRGLSRKEIETLKERGVFTVTQLAYTCRPKAIERSRTASKKHSLPLQAMAIRDKTIYVRRRPELPRRSVNVYLDIEGVPDRDFFYLIGMLIERQDESARRQFWAGSESEEQLIWHAMLRELSAAGDYTLFHFGRYERTFLEQMMQKYGSAELSDEFNPMSRLCDIHAAIRTNVYFPVYSNGLKFIANILGITWRGPIASGIESIVWRHRWENEQGDACKEALLEYNMDDCIALRAVATFLGNLGNPASEKGDIKISEHLPNQSSFTFGPTQFAIPELARFTKCAYFNYQRDKVFVRTGKRSHRKVRKKSRLRRPKFRISERIETPAPTACPQCGATAVWKFRKGRCAKVIQDVKFTARGVKRWDVEYSTHRFQCPKCRNTFYSPEYPTGGPKVGQSVAAWGVYQQVALRQSGYAVTESLNEVFGLCVSGNAVTRYRKQLAHFHEPTERGLVERIRSGNMICADEVKISVKHGSAYVWVFSTIEEVVYRFSPSREGGTLDEILNGFTGVLVSDFYGAYDAPACEQQKCLIHLIRDINDDLLKAPFNAELKEMAERFTELLKLIIDAIDRYGLKKRHLAKFLPKATQFLNWMNKREVQTKVAQGYQKRFQKYGTRLFTFLLHDGVPWNNNLAENAVKLIASRRAILGASFSEGGIQDYLRLLSIYQTLRRKGGSFLRFLLSKQTDVFQFLGE